MSHLASTYALLLGGFLIFGGKVSPDTVEKAVQIGNEVTMVQATVGETVPLTTGGQGLILGFRAGGKVLIKFITGSGKAVVPLSIIAWRAMVSKKKKS